MKQKVHSGLKKRVKVRKGGSISVQKSCKNHLLDNKSKKMKKSHLSGMDVDPTRLGALRRLMPGVVPGKRRCCVVPKKIQKKLT